MKKYISMAAGIVLLMMLQWLPVSAFSGQPPQIPDFGTLTIHKYALEPGQDAGAAGSGMPEELMITDKQPLGGVTFTVWQVDEHYIPADVTEARAHLIAASRQQKTTESDGTAVFTMPKGIYYVEETDTGNQSMVASEAFLVSIPMLNPSGDSWVTDVHVYPKNQAIFIDKFVGAAGSKDYDTAQIKAAKSKPTAIHTPFGFTILSSLPAHMTTGKTDTYVVTDMLKECFEYLPGTLRVYSVPLLDTPVASATVLEAGDYQVEYDATAHTLTVELTKSGIEKLRERYDDPAHQDRFLMIKYDSSLNELAPHGISIPTGAKVVYTQQQPDRVRTASVRTAEAAVVWEPAVHTGQIEIRKVDSHDQEKRLSGAEFGLAVSREAAENGQYLATGITNAEGILNFRGLLYGVPGDASDENSNATTYWLSEITPPAGYSKLEEPIQIGYYHQQDSETEEVYFARVTVCNALTDLPENSSLSGGYSGIAGKNIRTGDTDQLLFYAGSMLLALSIIAGLWRLKKGKCRS